MLFKSAIFLILFQLLIAPSLAQSTASRNLSQEADTPEFWDNVRVIPVQFLEKNRQTDGDIRLSAIFASRLVVERMEFLLLSDKNSDNEASFFEQKGQWEEKINRNDFLKKIKKDYWLTTYLKTDRENILIGAHQFKNWQAVKGSYAGHPEHLRRNVDNVDFWQEMRINVLYVHQINENKVYWMFLDPIEITEPVTESDRQMVNLANGQTVYKRLANANRGNDFRVISQGIFYIQPNTVFHRQEIEDSKPKKMLKFTITDAKLRLKSVILDKEYFLQNYQSHFWICFYDSRYQSLVRVIETPEIYPEKDKK